MRSLRRSPGFVSRPITTAALATVTALLVGCGSAPKPGNVYSSETFGANSAHSRTFPVAPGGTCEAARRALLSHGYLVERAGDGSVDGRKRFQPSDDSHIEIAFHVVCADEGRERTTVFASAVQDRYALKRTSSSASLGVGPLGSLSVPFGSSSDSMVKVASETIAAAVFYERFFALIEHYLALRDDDDEPVTPAQPSAAEGSPARGAKPPP